MKLKITALILCIAFLSSCMPKRAAYPAPNSFVDVSRSMKTPYFWISKIENPDKVILSKKETLSLNKRTRNAGYLANVFNLNSNFCESLLKKDHRKVVKKYSKYYDSSLKRVGKKSLESLVSAISCNLATEKSFAITTGYAQLRILPTSEPLYSSLSSTNLDRLQQTQLDFASPLAVFFSTPDERWYYVVSEIAEGWVKSDSIAFGPKKDIEKYKKRKDIAVVVSKQADLYDNAKTTVFYDNVRMGSVLPIVKKTDDIVEVEIPLAQNDGKLGFKKVFAKRADVSLDFLPYTQRNIITQAFKYIDMPYGWGDDSGYPDCSSFIRQIFSCFGVVFPRNSYAQSQVGRVAINFDKQLTIKQKIEKILEKGRPGITIMYFPGHIMLYLGDYNGKPYIIHSLGEYGVDAKTVYIFKMVAVTGMSVGENSKRKSFVERLTLMKIIK
ncbi:MAG: SH3 domain-containing protein [Endomicrobium sp.]|jgi:cell wall-associated NlpC family hydrolase|nr:SH3 domain-containing protein [Endomicrobium sp.]